MRDKILISISDFQFSKNRNPKIDYQSKIS